MENNVYNKFQENKQLFKQFVSWPDSVHLGLNNVDVISNSFLSNLQLKSNEHLLWVSRHQANWKSKDVAEKTPCGCIITDMRIYFRNIASKKEFEVAWADIHSIIHETHTFYLQTSGGPEKSEFAISDYAMLNQKIDNNNPIVAFLNDVVGNIPHVPKENCVETMSVCVNDSDAIKAKPTTTATNKDNNIISKNVKNSISSDLSSKESIKGAYKQLQSILKDSQGEVFALNGVNSQFNTIKKKISKAFDTKFLEAKKDLDSSLKDTVWDNLVIAFFGETNAGKSTIIETFRILFDDKRKKEDGLIVGDGQHDFTKTYEEYHLSISGQPFTLIDVPGIEGDEAEFKDVIKTALHKAHCVFYVQGHNKKPDRKTAEKIKKYLGDWVKVYSIYNVRGGVGNYDEEEERETLLTPGILKTESLIQTEFKSILGDVYAGHVTLQGLLAMSAKASFSPKREDLLRGQQKLLRYFSGDSDKVLEFSQFKTLTNLVEQKSANFKAEIIEANKQKLISLAGKVAKDMEDVMESQKDYLNTLESNLRTVQSDICNNSMSTASRNIKNKTKNAIDATYGNLKNDIFQLIESEPADIKSKAESSQRSNIRKLEDSVRFIVTNELSKISDTANRKIKGLDGVNIQPIHFDNSVNLKTEIDFSGALEELDVDFGDVVGWVGKTAGTAAAGAALGSVIPGVGTAIGGIAGGIFGGIVHALSGDGGKADARKSVSDAIEKAKQRAKNNVDSMLSPVIKNIDEQKQQLQRAVKLELENIETLQGTLDNFGEEINDFVKGIKHKRYGRI